MEFDTTKQNKALQRAESMADEFDPQESAEFIKKHTDAKWYDDFMLLYSMVTDKGFDIDTKTYLAIAGALAYVVLPIDIIPDFIPGVGWIDDIFVIGFVMKSISEEIERYRAYTQEI
ncbi:hypothetical protein MNB_SV-6-1596 [hydrothermal vent metagenome]|uniref:DUF1232 domain-containing protein n=1 Tax=hydrothermal vent metagenome TaxID=652676 RepID=A0A1W1C572_9ZZZZ